MDESKDMDLLVGVLSAEGVNGQAARAIAAAVEDRRGAAKLIMQAHVPTDGPLSDAADVKELLDYLDGLLRAGVIGCYGINDADNMNAESLTIGPDGVEVYTPCGSMGFRGPVLWTTASDRDSLAMEADGGWADIHSLVDPRLIEACLDGEALASWEVDDSRRLER